MSTIRSTVTEALTEAGRSSYLSYAEPVITALEEREAAIVEAVSTVAQQRGLRDTDVQALLIQVGLAEEPEPEPVAVSGDNTDAILQRLESLAAQVQALTSAAARHGVRV